MTVVPERLERDVIDDFSRKAKSIKDLIPLEEYIYRHPKAFYPWHVYLHLARHWMKPETYKRVVRIAERQLGGGLSEEDILLPEPTWVQQD